MRFSCSFRSTLLAGGIIAALAPAASHAQSVDYGTFEQMFGEPITTSVTGKPQRASQVPGDLTIITQDDIRRSGADNIPDILQFVTGIDVRTYGFNDTEVAVRGYNQPLNPRLLVMVNGRQVYLDDYGYVAWNMIPVQLDEIRQIEVVKGPNSALFGFNAASGVINIITYDPLLDKVNTATVRGGTQGFGGGDGVATLHYGTTAGIRVSVGGDTATGYPLRDDGSQPRETYGSFNADGVYQLQNNVQLRASGGYTDGAVPRQVSLLGGDYDTQDRNSYVRGGAAWQSKAGLLDLDVYRNEDLLGYVPGSGAIDSVVTVVKLSDLVQIDASNTIRAGFEYRNNAVSQDSTFDGTLAYDNYAVNGMWDWVISPMFDLTNAVRLDHLDLHAPSYVAPIAGRTVAEYNDTTITQPSFNSGLVVKLTDIDTLRLTAARGLQIPSLVDFGLDLHVPPVYIVGQPMLTPTAVWNFELGYDRPLGLLGAKFSSAVFFQRNTDILASEGDTPVRPFAGGLLTTSANIGSSNEIGFEAGLRGTPGNFRWNLSYRYESITQDISAFYLTAPNWISKPDDGTPAHEIIAGAGYTLGKWELDVAGRWQSSYTDYRYIGAFPVPVLIDNYVTFNAHLGYRVTDYLTLSGTADQFNVSRLAETANGYVDRRLFASATVHF